MGYDELLTVLEMTPELHESKQYYIECLEAVNGNIKYIEEKVKFMLEEDDSVRDDLAMYRLKVERVDLISRKKSYENFLKSKTEALDRNVEMENILDKEYKRDFDSTIEQLKNSNHQKHTELKKQLLFTDFSSMSHDEKKKIYVKIKAAQ